MSETVRLKCDFTMGGVLAIDQIPVWTARFVGEAEDGRTVTYSLNGEGTVCPFEDGDEIAVVAEPSVRQHAQFGGSAGLLELGDE